MRLVREFSPKQLEWRNDPSTRLVNRQSGIISQGEHEAWLREIDGNPSCIYFGLEIPAKRINGFKRKAEIVGYVGLSNIQANHMRNHGTAEYSILIGPEHRGKGYGKEGMKLLLNYAFKCAGVVVVHGEILETNPAGLELALGRGFTKDGVLRGRYVKQGKRINSISVSITDHEWAAHGKQVP